MTRKLRCPHNKQGNAESLPPVSFCFPRMLCLCQVASKFPWLKNRYCLHIIWVLSDHFAPQWVTVVSSLLSVQHERMKKQRYPEGSGGFRREAGEEGGGRASGSTHLWRPERELWATDHDLLNMIQYLRSGCAFIYRRLGKRGKRLSAIQYMNIFDRQ